VAFRNSVSYVNLCMDESLWLTDFLKMMTGKVGTAEVPVSAVLQYFMFVCSTTIIVMGVLY